MRTVLASLAVVIPILCQTAEAQTVVWDQGPFTEDFSGALLNTTTSQNFADNVTFAVDTVVNGYNMFTWVGISAWRHAGASDFHLKILADNGGLPGSVVFAADVGLKSFNLGLTRYVDELNFDLPAFTFAGGVTYWVGLSGNGFDPSQAVLWSDSRPELALFGASTFIRMEPGSQMFQLTFAPRPVPVPEPSSDQLLFAGLGAIALGAILRRRRV